MFAVTWFGALEKRNERSKKKIGIALFYKGYKKIIKKKPYRLTIGTRIRRTGVTWIKYKGRTPNAYVGGMGRESVRDNEIMIVSDGRTFTRTIYYNLYSIRTYRAFLFAEFFVKFSGVFLRPPPLPAIQNSIIFRFYLIVFTRQSFISISRTTVEYFYFFDI